MCACRIRGRGLRVYVSFKHASLSLSGRAWLVHNCDSNLARHYHPSLLLSAMTLVKLVSLVSLTWVTIRYFAAGFPGLFLQLIINSSCSISPSLIMTGSVEFV